MIESSPNELAAADLQRLADYLKALAEPNRLRIFDLLMQGVQCNCELGSQLQMAPNLISHHLAALRKAGLVQAERDPVDSRWIYYSVDRRALAVLNPLLASLLDPARIQPRQPVCGPQATRRDAITLTV